MSETADKGYIAKKAKGSGEYEDLYLEGVELLQKLSGAIWTDYNEHDPGVTILENIVYTMTNLSFKTQQPIRDILAESKGGRLESGDNGFFVPSDILTTNPVTINDFRKIFIDKITNVKNVWIKPLKYKSTGIDESDNNNSINGLYRIYVGLYNYSTDETITKNEKIRIVKEIKELFHEHRNLCEDLYDITIIKPYNLYLKLKLTLGELFNGEDVFANIFYKINDYLSHEIQFSSLWELREKGVNINTIFNGPLLENGFISDSELHDQLCCIVPSEIMKIISKVEGVISVDFFELTHGYDGQEESVKVADENILISEDYFPVLKFPKQNSDLELQHKGLKFFPDISEVKKQMSYIQAMNYGSFRSVSKSINIIEIPEGNNLNLDYYYSVRNQFPLNYGTGKFGLSSRATPERQAQVNQLKAYLLPFDQLMANFLAQLTSLYKLYDTKNNNLNSYFYQELDDMPDLVKLIKNNDIYPDEDPLINWKIILKELNSDFDQKAVLRLNEIADNLLARFGEQFPTYSLRKIHTNCYGKKLTSQQFEEDLLGWKRTLISNYGNLSYNRAKAFDYTRGINTDPENTKEVINNTPAVIQKVAVLMGIKNLRTRFLSKLIADSGIKIYQKRDGFEMFGNKLEIICPSTDVGVFELDNILIIDKKVENLRDSIFYSGNSENILQMVLAKGILADNYSIKQTDGDKGNNYYVLFNGTGQLNVIHISDSEYEADQTINSAINFLIDINEQSEGLYIIEHLLLAPPYHGEYFGFSFSLQSKDSGFTEFNHVRLQSCGDRADCVNEILNGFTGGNKVRVVGKGDTYVIRIVSPDGVELAEASEVFMYKQDALQKVNEISEQLKTDNPEQIISEVKYYAYYGDNKVDETFFSFQVSLIMPSWPVRFQDDNFRAKMENILYEQIPAHIAFQLYWIDLNEMIGFEEIYYKWFELISNNKHSEERINTSYRIITEIQKYYQNNNH